MKIKLEHRGREIWLESDTNNYIVHEGYKPYFDKKAGVERQIQKNPAYYSDLAMALNGILKKGVRNSDATTLHQLYNEIGELKRLILNRTELQ